MNKSMLMKSFNTHFVELLQDIITIFPDNKDIQYAKTSFESLKQMNPALIIKVWFSYIYTPYATIIDNGDISFFFDKSYENDLSMVSNAKEIMGMIDKLRDDLAHRVGAKWKDMLQLTLSFADGSSARISAINAALKPYRPNFMHFWQLKTFWNETKVM